MYSKSFYITRAVGNNSFSYENRENKKIYVPSLIKAKIKDISFGTEIAFEDFGFDDKLSTNTGLKNFYEFDWNDKKIFLFDNHNHALYFWYLSRDLGYINDDNILVHIDEHADMRDPLEYIYKPDSYDLEKVFNYVNFSNINVGNYIIPAQKEGLLSEIIQIRNKTNLDDYLSSFEKKYLESNKKIILNLDLDFFQPDLDYIDYDLKKKVILDVANKASVITVSTSPFFIEQDLAINVFKDIFN